jgi:hypothetical protein
MTNFLKRQAFYVKNRALNEAAQIYRRRRVKNQTIKIHTENEQTKSIFIHVPKTGGFSVGQAIYGMDPGHYHLRQYQEIANLDDYFTFGIVRHPATRLASMHVYFQRRRVLAPVIADFKLANGFRDFLEIYFDLSQRATHAMLWRQTDYILDDTGNIGVDFLARMERLDQDFETIKQRTNSPDATLPHLNKTLGQHNISDDDMRFIKSKLPEEFEVLGYE